MESADQGSGSWVGPYELVQRLGRGGMGEVWEAVLHGPAGFEKPVALKCLDSERMGDPALSSALIREARLGAKLQHPNVVGTFSLSEHGGRWVVALELVRRSEGFQLGNLGNLYVRQGRPEQARPHYEAALTFHLERQNRAEESTVRYNLARLLWLLGHLDEAERHIELGIAAAREVGRPHMEAALNRVLAEVAQDRGRADEARAHLEAALGWVRETDHQALRAAILGDLAVVLAPADPPRALTLVDEAQGLLVGLGDPALVAELLAARAEVLSFTGDHAGSEAALTAAWQAIPSGDIAMEHRIDTVAQRLGLEGRGASTTGS